jgi:ubiquinone/menaquinone biosynthesis C-methylase UbiE
MSQRAESLWWRLVRFGFRLLYYEMAWTYDFVSWGVSLGHWRKWQHAAIPHLQTSPDDLILEIAHGTANLQIDLAQAGLKAIGLDLSPYMGRIARRKLRRARLEARLVRGSALQLPFADSQFKAIAATFPTEFIVQHQTLTETRRVLKPGGRLVVVPNGMLELANPLNRFLEWLYQITGQRGPWPDDPLIAFRRAGFEAELVEEKLVGSQVWIVVAVKPASS